MYSADIKKLERNYLPKTFTLKTWEDIAPFFEELHNREINNKEALEKWLQNISEVEAAVSEDACWRQIKMTCDTENTALRESFEYFCMHIQPQMQPWADKLNRKFIDNPFVAALPQEQYKVYLRSVKNSIALFREVNIPVQAEVAVLQQQYGAITGAMVVTIDDKEYTLQQAAKFLENPDRNKRKLAYHAINDRRLQDTDKLDDLYNQLIAKRTLIANNAGYDNYIKYRFAELNRFDYEEKACFEFHDAVEQHVLPLVNEIYKHKKEKLQLDNFRPYDVDAEPEGIAPLIPFQTTKELLDKTVACFNDINPFFAACLTKMNAMGHFDLESRKGKAPGGYNCPLSESGAPFIFMNAAGQMHDVTTMVHEGGHAVHSFLAHALPLSAFKEYPMEVAEVASMAMELFSMEYWNRFFDNEEELKRAKLHQLERVITIFPWIATIDAFQHWIYANPTHTNQQRQEAWVHIQNRFSNSVVNYEGLDNYRAYQWQKQLHLYEVPFYYIEYGIAQLGAIGMWMQFKQDKQSAINNYCNALSLGGTKTLPELYKAAGLTFDFSSGNIEKLMQFVKKELDHIHDK
jgi:oligoendopeptidase F